MNTAVSTETSQPVRANYASRQIPEYELRKIPFYEVG
jgi:hypothetical protein